MVVPRTDPRGISTNFKPRKPDLMSFKAFMLALAVSFGIPWLLIIVVPFGKMRNLEPVHFEMDNDGKDEVYVPRRSGRIATGSAVYGANGCYVCHTQIIRAGYAGSELGRPNWAGIFKKNDKEEVINAPRETTPYDYVGESFAHIGIMRIGPDLSNVAGRIQLYLKDKDLKAGSKTPENWLFKHLYNPQLKRVTFDSKCPSQEHLFVVREVYGQGSPDAVPGLSKDGKEVLPSDKARALVSYLLSLRKDDKVPYSINYSRDKKKAE